MMLFSRSGTIEKTAGMMPFTPYGLSRFGCTGGRATAYPDGINQVKDVE
ncbi:hypothetical protein [Aeromonas enterica]